MKSRWLALMLMASGCVMAADGTITITGEIQGSTCTVSGSNSATPGTAASFPIVLDRVQASALNAENAVAAYKPFFIHIGGGSTNCPPQPVAVLFERSSPAISTATGNLVNQATTSAAANVEVQIIDVTASRQINLSLGAPSTSVTIDAAGTATLPFAAQYIAVGGPAGPGLVNTSVQYSVTFP
ncbi:type 1 fimbrial protein [Pseudomonas kairouanensis]|uniref:Type 1 fimbrial protein n=1 Tax=Pseudomonas kairouanensis TaxID=2293832 RepID=A0A4Z0ALN9_9PSED|nr:fimbrial protein [Pseudomonas kairouanensis]TFY87545.1 type 1 fimbrial protein [Pseudomonas kairouanensis]